MNLEPIRELVSVGEQAKQRPDDHVAWTLRLGHAARKASPALSQVLEAVTWIKCSERMPPENEVVLVWLPGEDGGIDFDYREENGWGRHDGSYEHFMAVGGSRAGGPDATCTGPSEEAPYTHWMPLPSPPEDK